MNKIDNELYNSLKETLNSSENEEDIRFIVSILNNSNMKDDETRNRVMELVGCNDKIHFHYSQMKFKFYSKKEYYDELALTLKNLNVL